MQVEKAPVIIKAGISKAEAEEMSKKIEAGKVPGPKSNFCPTIYFDTPLCW